MAIIYVDMDGICDDFNKALVEDYNQRAKEPVSVQDITTWKLEDCLPDKEAVKWALSRLDVPGWWNALPLMAENVPEILKRWNQKHKVYILSSPWNALSAKEKYERVDKHFPFLGRPRVILAKDKHLMQGDLIVDDKPSNLMTYHEHNPEAKLATIRYPHHTKPIEDGDMPRDVFYANSYAHPKQAWEQLDEFVKENL